jgi:hypothetical protein
VRGLRPGRFPEGRWRALYSPPPRSKPSLLIKLLASCG